jgi:hypothetical protein
MRVFFTTAVELKNIEEKGVGHHALYYNRS